VDPRQWTRRSGWKEYQARALLEKARVVNSGNELLWEESVGVEKRSGGAAQAKTMLARAFQECPSSGLLLLMMIWAEPRAGGRRGAWMC